MSDLPEYVTDRIFDAPRELVWKTWTDPELLARWYGPNIETIIHKFELKPGGEWLNEMKWGGKSDLSKMTFTEVIPQEKLVWRQSSCDADWNAIANPMMPDWPRVILTTVTFDDHAEQTKVRLTWTPVDASESEIACFAAAVDNMGKGWGSGFDIIDSILAELRSSS